MNGDEDSTLPTGWAPVELGALLPLNYGKGLTEERRDSSGRVPVYGSSGIVGYHSAALTRGPALIIGRKGAVGEVHLSREPCWPIDTTYYSEAPAGLNPTYLAYLLQLLGLGHLDKSTAVPSLRRDDYNAVRAAVAPEPEQTRIVAEIEKQFTRLEAGVATLQHVKANLKRYRAAVLKAAVEGRLVPTEAELARRESHSYEPAGELLQRILAERRARWEADQFARLRASGKERKDANRKARYKDPACPDTTNAPVLPDGWTWAAVEQVSRLVQYGSSAKTTEESNGVPVLRMINIMSDGRLNLKDLKYLPPYHKEFPALLLQTGDLLFNRTNSPGLVGKSAVYNGTPSPCSFASYLIRVRTMEGCSPTFLAFCLNSAWGRSWIKSVVSQQVGQANVNGSKLQGFVFPLPPWGEQRRIVAETERRLSVMDELEMHVDANLKRAERLRQAILKRAFEGKLVPHDPNDEPASVLLERIRAERDNRQVSPFLRRRRLTEAIGKIRGQHAEPNSL